MRQAALRRGLDATNPHLISSTIESSRCINHRTLGGICAQPPKRDGEVNRGFSSVHEKCRLVSDQPNADPPVTIEAHHVVSGKAR
jgi:hypothetical protein